MKNTNKSNFAKTFVLIGALIVIGISSTYAYFTTVISGSATTTELTAGKLQIESNLNEVGAINNLRMKLINSSDKATEAEKVTFTVTNSSDATVGGNYYIYLKDINITKNLYSSYFRWELLKNNEVVSSGTFADATRKDTAAANEDDNVSTTANDIQLNTTALTVSKNSTDTLIFRLWLEDDASVNQLSLTEGTFSGRLYLEAVPVSSNS